MERPLWQNTRLVPGGVEDEIRRMKAAPGKAINIQGSASIVQALAQADLVDEYSLFVHPIVLGAGTPLFARGAARGTFHVTTTKVYGNGVIHVEYLRKR
jgi:dihydrofolate reductase